MDWRNGLKIEDWGELLSQMLQGQMQTWWYHFSGFQIFSMLLLLAANVNMPSHTQILTWRLLKSSMCQKITLLFLRCALLLSHDFLRFILSQHLKFLKLDIIFCVLNLIGFGFWDKSWSCSWNASHRFKYQKSRKFTDGSKAHLHYKGL